MPERHDRVLLVEDDDDLARLLAEELSDRGLHVRTAPSAEEAWEILGEGEPVDLVISDLRLPGVGGEVLLAQTVNLPRRPGFIVITAHATVSRAVDCLKAGADDFLTKPLDLEHLHVAVQRALEHRRLVRALERYEEVVGSGDFHGMVGRSGPMRRLFDQIRVLAHSEGPVLIQGESGTGKELVARAIHDESRRSSRIFLAVNCAGIPESLLESEFFGHEAGAFTGATGARSGLFEEASGGTLFLDEIAEMSPALQAKLLRVLQEGRLRRVGSNREREVDVRVVAATNRELEVERDEGRFRDDLYYRLETFRLRVPPLREREEDLELLSAHFLRKHAARLNKDIRGMAPDAVATLRAHPFPGNVRELENALERAVTFARGEVVERRHLPDRIATASPQVAVEAGPLLRPSDSGPPPLEEVERRYVRHVLDLVDGNKSRAAGILGIARRTLYRKLEE